MTPTDGAGVIGTVAAGVFTFTFPTDGITVKVDRLHNGREELKADIRVASLRLGEAGHIHHTRLNLMTTQGKKAVAEACRKRLPEIDWDALIEQVAVNVVERARAGEPAVRLAEVAAKESLLFVRYPYLLANAVTLIFGLGGALKSLFAGLLGVECAYGLSPAEPLNVLVLDWEDSEGEWADRVRMMCAGLAIPVPSNLHYRFCTEQLADDIEAVQGLVAEHNIGLIIVDSAAYATGEPEQSDATTRFFTALRAVRTTTLVIAHQTNEKDTKRPFGSVYWRNGPRSVWQSKTRQEPGGESVELGLFHRKANRGRLIPAQGYRVTFTVQNERQYTPGDAITFTPINVKDVPELAKDLHGPDRVLAMLAHGKASPPEIAEELEELPGNVRTWLTRLLERRQVVKLGKEYGLAATPSETATV